MSTDTAPQENHYVDEDEIFVNIQIFPGMEVRSGYSDDRINELSAKIIQIALVLFIFQALVSIVVLSINFSIGMIILQLFNISIYLAIYWAAVQCVKSRNAPLCSQCCRPLSVYRVYLCFTMFVLFIIIALYIGDVPTGRWWSFVGLSINTVIFWLNFVEFYFSSKLIRILYGQVHIAPPDAAHDIEMQAYPTFENRP